jgi:hypothetical protein
VKIACFIVLSSTAEHERYQKRSLPIHLSLVGDKIWFQYDDTEEGVATDLMAAGVPREDLVLGFRHPKIRQHAGFAIA